MRPEEKSLFIDVNERRKVRLNWASIFFLLIATLPQASCKKYLEVAAPVTSTNAENVYTSDATAAAVLTGVYANLSYLNFDLGGDGLTSVALYTGLSGDELSLYSLNNYYAPFYTNDLVSSITNGNFWAHIYNTIFYSNTVIEGLEKSSGLTKEVKDHLLGEAKFLRAFYYFYIINLYGDAPLTTSSDYKFNSLLSRSPVEKIYEQVIADLKDAQRLLSGNYLMSDALTAYTGAEQRVRPNKWAATALLARVYLYTGDWAAAETEASSVINQSGLYGLSPMLEVFKMNSKETIWALQPVGNGVHSNTGEGTLFILPATGPNDNPNTVYLSDDMAGVFEANDQRKAGWVGKVAVGSTTYFFPYKYKIGAEDVATSEYIMVLRLAEQYLIRAEARAQLNNVAGSREDIDVIRSRAGLSGTTANDKASLLNAVMQERRVELFTEWGNRWFDMKRTKTINSIMTDISLKKGGTWSAYKSLYPIPQYDMRKDPNLVQNEGY